MMDIRRATDRHRQRLEAQADEVMRCLVDVVDESRARAGVTKEKMCWMAGINPKSLRLRAKGGVGSDVPIRELLSLCAVLQEDPVVVFREALERATSLGRS